jgi:prepilin-type N-terminal cleavage/methylation domain-containing protein
MSRQRYEQGFSLLELLLTIAISSVLILAVGNFTVTSIVGSNQDYNKTLVLSNAKEAVSIVARQIKAAKSVQPNNTLPDPNAPGAPGNLYSWSGAAGNAATLILAVPSRDGNNNLIYADTLHNSLYTDDVIFYLDTATKRLY